ncbi:hypothetical protein LOZ53_006413 [Ophidiomyces ophidiicola]|uniref:Uncharacterized protein n=1 Tax=Ophidiomyces ophidiicola TaxID=1387563 RepID=A0ACB8UTV4_9EURO|nr:uncharacterized protein LOZ57_005770 [Ophidiomyces ophidiicola]KAI1909615.1 hypothetical protein LOZ61_004918 [Ophidiomyces ophidiicola]KAI1913064.1 hypothetical protein LOZ64_004217 [Ophidiomyces ophidiicola]KAI1924867.1 hypothetical protein LOZ60_004467 [Ophidiomyces ophidiicola]KAI1941080.1 hypothetical protein LOZ57_005770 [Ophidiomyces ophidiicola]KAI1943126.1 hypothetical protein LOZ62_004442 [Ophidiomyces ophidiicola]
MLAQLFTALALSACFAGALPTTPRDVSANTEACAAVHIMSARGSNQAAGEGSTLAPVATALAALFTGATREAIVWPAKIIPYDTNSAQGTQAVTRQLTAYVKRCPNSKIVMLGYSQGAHVIGDSLCGGGGVAGIGPVTPPIAREIGNHGTFQSLQSVLLDHR